MYTIYSKDHCSNCEKTRMFLYMKGLEFQVKKLDVDFDIQEYMKIFQIRSFPAIVKDTGEVYKSFEELQDSI